MAVIDSLERSGGEGEATWLLVRKTPALSERQEKILPLLQNDYGIDAYAARQKLTGQGPSLFAKGGASKIGEMKDLLARHDLAGVPFAPPATLAAPVRVRALSVGEDAILFTTPSGEVSLPRGARVLAVVAELSGATSKRVAQRLLAQNAYRGIDNLTPIEDDDLLRTILRSDPVLDIHFFGGEEPTVLRLRAGKFDPAGLGQRKSLSAGGNVGQVVELLREYAGEFRLDLEFCLSSIPNCQPKPDADEMQGLKALTRYGSLMSGVWLQEATENAPAPLPFLDPLLKVLGEDEGEGRKANEPAEAKRLPTPPPVVAKGWAELYLTPWSIASTLSVGGGILAVQTGHGDSLASLAEQTMKTGVLPAIASAAMLWGGFRYLRLKRMIENTPTSRIRSMASGMVEVHGRAKRKYALVSQMSQIPCIYYRLRKYRRKHRSGSSTSSWVLVSDVSSDRVPFLLQDETGTVTVDPKGASIAGTRREGAGGYAPHFLVSGETFQGNEKWVEDIIYEGTNLYVLGMARPRREAGSTLRERTALALRRLKGDREAMKRYDADGDGQISQQEWEAARADVEQKVLHRSLAEGGGRKRQEEHLEIAHPTPRSLPFLIAETSSEERLTRRFNTFSIALFSGAVGTAAWAIHALTKTFIHP